MALLNGLFIDFFMVGLDVFEEVIEWVYSVKALLLGEVVVEHFVSQILQVDC